MPRKRTAAEAAALIAAHHAAPRTKRGRPEALIQASIVAALKRAGFAVYSTSQGFRAAPGGTRCTPGLPDLYAYNPCSRFALWIEVKALAGQLRGAQLRFLELHGDPKAGDLLQTYCWNRLELAENWLRLTGHMVQRPDGAWRFPYRAGEPWTEVRKRLKP